MQGRGGPRWSSEALRDHGVRRHGRTPRGPFLLRGRGVHIQVGNADRRPCGPGAGRGCLQGLQWRVGSSDRATEGCTREVPAERVSDRSGRRRGDRHLYVLKLRDLRKGPRLLQWSARVPAARANLSDARTVGRPPTTATALNQVRGSRARSLDCKEKWEKSWPEGQVVESGLETPSAAVPSVAIATAAAAATTAAAEGSELELSVPSAAAAAPLAAVAAASIAGLALV